MLLIVVIAEPITRLHLEDRSVVQAETKETVPLVDQLDQWPTSQELLPNCDLEADTLLDKGDRHPVNPPQEAALLNPSHEGMREATTPEEVLRQGEDL